MPTDVNLSLCTTDQYYLPIQRKARLAMDNSQKRTSESTVVLSADNSVPVKVNNAEVKTSEALRSPVSARHRGCNERSSRHLSSGGNSHSHHLHGLCPAYGVKAVCGPRHAMEDAHVVLPNFYHATLEGTPASAYGPFHFFGIYDGHGGNQVAQYCSQQLHKGLLAQLKKISTSQQQVVVEEAIREAFLTTDAELHNFTLSASIGSTAVILLVTPQSIWVAHCGDSRAVLGRAGEALDLTNDHRPNRKDETVRVQEAGGMILWNGGQRVMGILATTRSLGDHDLKPYGVTASPEVKQVARCPQDDLLVMASDGLWEVLSSKEACTIALRCLKRAEEKGASPRAAARVAADVLVRMAVDKGSRDDITVIVVDLKNLERHYSVRGDVTAGCPATSSSGVGRTIPEKTPDEALQQAHPAPPLDSSLETLADVSLEHLHQLARQKEKATVHRRSRSLGTEDCPLPRPSPRGRTSPLGASGLRLVELSSATTTIKHVGRFTVCTSPRPSFGKEYHHPQAQQAADPSSSPSPVPPVMEVAAQHLTGNCSAGATCQDSDLTLECPKAFEASLAESGAECTAVVHLVADSSPNSVVRASSEVNILCGVPAASDLGRSKSLLATAGKLFSDLNLNDDEVFSGEITAVVDDQHDVASLLSPSFAALPTLVVSEEVCDLVGTFGEEEKGQGIRTTLEVHPVK